MSSHPLIWILMLPLAGALLVALAPARAARSTALAVMGAHLGLGLYLAYALFDRSQGAMQWAEDLPWIPALGVRFSLGVDGLALILLLLNALVHLVAVIATRSGIRAPRAYYALLLLLAAAVNGVFLATDLFLFYVCWELVLVPMYFLIGVWGGAERVQAATKFLLFTLGGSVLLLIAIVAVHLSSGADGLEPSFNIYVLQSLAGNEQVGAEFLGLAFREWVFLLFFLGFAVKIPVFPLHTWLPAAHVQAPTPVSVVLAGVLLKLGAYGMLRIALPLAGSTAASWAGALALLGVVNIVYGAWVALGQRDFKRMVAYSSISHMGFFLLGVAAALRGPFGSAGEALAPTGAPLADPRYDALAGGSLQLFTHGLSAALMFLIVGVVQRRAGHRDLERMGGFAARMPRLTAFALVGFFASLGLPGLAGFVSEVMVIFGSWAVYPGWTLLSCAGLLLVAAFLARAFRLVFTGPPSDAARSMADLDARESWSMAPLVLLCIAIGVAPALLLDLLLPTLRIVLATLSHVVSPSG